MHFFETLAKMECAVLQFVRARCNLQRGLLGEFYAGQIAAWVGVLGGAQKVTSTRNAGDDKREFCPGERFDSF